MGSLFSKTTPPIANYVVDRPDKAILTENMNVKMCGRNGNVTFDANPCLFTDNGLYAKLDEIHYIEFLLEDITYAHISFYNDNDLEFYSYPLIEKQRSLLTVTLSFANRRSAKLWYDLIIDAIKAPLAPHFKSGTIRKMRRFLVIINPFSGKKMADEIFIELIKIFLRDQIDFHSISTEYVGHACETAQNVCLDDYDGFALIGGDGLVAEIINGFLLRADRERAIKFPIIPIPAGTSNGLAAAISFNCNEPFRSRQPFSLEMIIMMPRPRFIPLRICHVQTEFDGTRSMFMSASWGLFADIDIESERFRWIGSWRFDLEGFIRIARLPVTSAYKARITYLPVEDDELKRATLLLRTAKRLEFGVGHFDCAKVENVPGNVFISSDTIKPKDMEEVLHGCDTICDGKMPSLCDPLPDDWKVIEGKFVYVCLVSISHLAGHIAYVPSARLDDDIMYLTIVDWNTITSRLEVAKMMGTYCTSRHLLYPFFQVIPVRGCRIEPLDGCGGNIAIDGEPITPGSAFQIAPSKYCATVIGRKTVSEN